MDRELEFTNTPNLLTLSRILMIPAVIGALWMRQDFWDWVAALLFGLAAITDYFDGYFARKQKLITVYGQLMDPLADKFLVASCLIMLQHLQSIHPIVVMLLICREFAITGLRALASAEGVIIAASPSAKWKTATQMVAIPFLMVHDKPLGIPFFEIGGILLYISLAISLGSAAQYVRDFFVGFRKARQARKMARKLKLEQRRQQKKLKRQQQAP